MARISDDRISHLAHLAIRSLSTAGELRDERRALTEAKRVLAAELQSDSRLDRAVRARMPRRAREGTAEWDVMYRKLLEEERRKRR